MKEFCLRLLRNSQRKDTSITSKVIVALLLAVIMIFPAPVTTFAQSVSTAPVEEKQTARDLEADIQAAKHYVDRQIIAGKTEVDLSQYSIPYTDKIENDLTRWILSDYSEYTIHSSCDVEYTIKDGFITGASLTYYPVHRIMKAKTIELTKDIMEHPELTDLEKTILLHDRLTQMCNYDHTFKSKYRQTAYGALVSGESVCEGYTMAYAWLLNYVGVENYLCMSNNLMHIWNVVVIDGVEYYVDVTWDDLDDRNSFGFGRVRRGDMLKSTDVFLYSHRATDYPLIPSCNRLDNVFWNNAESCFQLVDGEVYCLDNQENTIKRFDDGDTEVIYTLKENPYARFNSNSILASDGKDLFFSEDNSIYKLDIKSGTATEIYCASDDYDAQYICGLIYSEGDFRIGVSLNDGTYIQTRIPYNAKPQKKAKSLSVLTTENTYYQGDDINLQVWLEYTDGSFERLYEGYTVSKPDTTTAGEKTITVKYGKLTENITVEVQKPEIYFSHGQYIKIGKTLTVKFRKYSEKAEIKSIVSSDSSIISVSNGVATAVSPGLVEVTVNYTYNGIELTESLLMTVVGDEPYITQISFHNFTHKYFYVGDEYSSEKCELELIYSDGTTKSIKEGFEIVGFSTEKAGTCDLEIYYQSYHTTYNLSVLEPRITIREDHYEITKDYLHKNISYDNYSSTEEVFWESADTSIVTVNNGKLTPVSVGTTEVKGYIIQNGKVYSDTCTVEVVPEDCDIKSIEVHTPPHRTKYFEFEDLNPDGMTIKVNYKNGTSKITDKFRYSGIIKDSDGTFYSRIEYTTDYTTHQCKYYPDINDILKNVKDSYEMYSGSSIDLPAIPYNDAYKVKWYVPYGDDDIISIVDGKICALKEGTVTIECDIYVDEYYWSAAGKDIEITVLPIPENIDSIRISTMPHKTEMPVGIPLDTTGLVLTVTKGKTTYDVCGGFTVSGYDKDKTGTQKVTITYGNASCSYNVVVKPHKPIASYVLDVKIHNEPYKTTYTFGEEFDTTGLVLAVEYADSTIEYITEGFTIDKEPFYEGSNRIIILYKHFYDTLYVDFELGPLENWITYYDVYEGDEIDVSHFNPGNLKLKWVSDNEDVAVVENGILKCKSEGYVNFDVTVEGDNSYYNKWYCSVYVNWTGIYDEDTDPTEGTTDDSSDDSNEDPTEDTTEDSTEDTNEENTEDSSEEDTDPTEDPTEDNTEENTEDPTDNITDDDTENATDNTTDNNTDDDSEDTTSGDSDEVTSLLIGDPNQDGKVNVKDATAIQKHIASLLTLSDRGIILADADRNSNVNIKDATAIQKHVAGMETGFPIGKEITK